MVKNSESIACATGAAGSDCPEPAPGEGGEKEEGSTHGAEEYAMTWGDCE